ncbi:uncharacterized protein [Rutidosis leptorrhynchoides]|uniref:uncharacterized protein n=1 Tax=Rutidosis leptorrhynchoides TaxID=125765 RepID=UPI003A9928E0
MEKFGSLQLEPFLATISAHIICRTGVMDISFGNRKMRINIFNSLHAPCVHKCYQVDVIDEQVKKHASHLITNDVVEVFYFGDEDETECEEVKAVELAIASTIDSRLPQWTHKYEPFPMSIDTNTKPSLESPSNLELKRFPSHLKYAFLGTNGNFPVIIASDLTDPDVKPARDTQLRLNPNMQEVVKKEWVSPTQTVPKKSGITFMETEEREKITTRPVTGWRGTIKYTFILMINKRPRLHVLTSFESCLEMLEKVLKRCTETNLFLSWEKSHFMVRKWVVLGQIVSERGFEVDRAKVKLISTLLPPTNVKGVRSFLGHAGFYRRFIKDFSAMSKPLCNLFLKDAPFDFNDQFLEAFTTLKFKLTELPILQSPDWIKPFEIMCDASDYAAGVVLGQRVDRKPVV